MEVRVEQGKRQGCNMVRGSWGIFRQIDFLSSKGGINEKITRRTIGAKGFNLLQERVDKKD